MGALLCSSGIVFNGSCFKNDVLGVGVLTGCDSFKQDSQDDSDGRGSNDNETTTMVMPVEITNKLMA